MAQAQPKPPQQPALAAGDDENDAAAAAAEKERLVGNIVEIQESLRDTLRRIETTKAEHDKVVSENEVLQKYINNLMVSTNSKA